VFAMAANERQREIGLLRATGATRGFIFKMVIMEAVLISGMGALIGIAASLGLVVGFSRLIAVSIEMPFYLPGMHKIVSLVFVALSLAILTGVFSALIPALQSSTKEPYEAIRQGAQ
jgi:putative ABC transport system permease protein